MGRPKIYPRSQGHSTVYLKNVITDPTIAVGDYTTYDDFVNDPRDFQRSNVLYHYPECNHDRLTIGKFCSIACGAKFIFNSANHSLSSLSTYPFPIFFEEWNLDVKDITKAWDNKGDIIIGNDVWIGYEAVVLAGVTIGDGAVIGTRAEILRRKAGHRRAETVERRHQQVIDLVCRTETVLRRIGDHRSTQHIKLNNDALHHDDADCQHRKL